jgi:proteasome lid subunit RPN8/RPN11
MILKHIQIKRLRILAKIAKSKGNFEVCGIVGHNRKDVITLFFLRNLANRAGIFRIKSKDVTDLENYLQQNGISIIASFHSHPISEAVPSKSDKKNAFLKERELIYDVIGRNMKMWEIKNLSVTEVKRRRCECGELFEIT